MKLTTRFCQTCNARDRIIQNGKCIVCGTTNVPGWNDLPIDCPECGEYIEEEHSCAPKFKLHLDGVCAHCGEADWSGFSCCQACAERLADERIAEDGR